MPKFEVDLIAIARVNVTTTVTVEAETAEAAGAEAVRWVKEHVEDFDFAVGYWDNGDIEEDTVEVVQGRLPDEEPAVRPAEDDEDA